MHPLGVRWLRGSTATVWASLALLALSGGGSPAHAQEDEGVRLGITYRPGYVPALAITDIETEAPFAAVAAAIDSVIVRDLDYSDRFLFETRGHFLYFEIGSDRPFAPEGALNAGPTFRSAFAGSGFDRFGGSCGRRSIANVEVGRDV